MINEDNTLALLQHISTNHETLCKILQYFSKAQTLDTQQQIDDQINSLQQRIQCIICSDPDRNTLLLPCKRFIACRECTLRFHNECPVCRTAVTQTISVLCQKQQNFFLKRQNERTKFTRKISSYMTKLDDSFTIISPYSSHDIQKAK